MILRRRSKPSIQSQNSNSPSTEYEVVQTKSLSFFPEEIDEKSVETVAVTSMGVAQVSSMNNQQQQEKRQKESVRDKIFSITASGVLLIAIISVGAFGFCISAQHSHLDRANHHSTTGRPGDTSGSRFRDLGSAGGGDTLMRQPSIDRFDSGGQIRAPLIRQPTTVPPLPRKANAETNLQAEASQESYQPEERNQWLQSQENHYQGGNSDQQQQPALDSSSSPSQVDNENAGNPMPMGRPQARASSPENSEPDESDYDDEGSADTASIVPEKRRMPAAAVAASSKLSARNQRGNVQQPSSSVDLEDQGTNPVDDYEGALNENDEHFSRNLAARDRNYLKQAASHNQQHKDRLPTNEDRNDGSSSAYNGPTGFTSRVNQDSAGPIGTDDPTRYGTSPNEAYLADKGESELAGVDPEEEGSNLNYPIPAGGQFSQIAANQGPNGDKFNRRAMDDSSDNNDDMQHSRPMSTDDVQSLQANQNEGDQADTEGNQSEVGDEASGSMDAPSSTGRVSGDRPENWTNRRRDPEVGTSDKAPKILAATPSIIGSNTRSVSNSGWVPFVKQSSFVQIHPKLPGEDLQPQPGLEPRSKSVPYNPQNNPSHAGKYFIT